MPPKTKLDKKYVLPCSKEYLESLYSKVFPSTRQGKDVLFLGLKECGKAGLLKFFVYDKSLAAKKLRQNYPKTTFLFINELSFNKEDIFWRAVAEGLGIADGKDIAALVKEIFSVVYEKTRGKAESLVIVLNQPAKWPFLTTALTDKLLALKRTYEEKICFVIVQDAGVEFDDKVYKNFLNRLVLDTTYFPVYDLEETVYQVKRNRYMLKKIEDDISDTTAKKIFELSGGIGGITKRLSVYTEEIDKQEVSEILKVPHIFNEVEYIFEDMERSLVQKLVGGEADEELQKMGLIDKQGKIKSKLVAEYLKSLDLDAAEPSKVELKLTLQESKAYSLLVKNKGELVTREDIAKAIWGENYVDKYTEWGIDSVISRLRKKVPGVEIKSVRGRGVVLEGEL